MGGDVGEAQRSAKVREVLEEPRPVRPLLEPAVRVPGEARGDGVPGRSGLVEGGDGALAGRSERALSTASPGTVSAP